MTLPRDSSPVLICAQAGLRLWIARPGSSLLAHVPEFTHVSHARCAAFHLGSQSTVMPRRPMRKTGPKYYSHYPDPRGDQRAHGGSGVVSWASRASPAAFPLPYGKERAIEPRTSGSRDNSETSVIPDEEHLI